MLRIATIVPTLYLTMTESENYRLALAHLLHNQAYANFFRQEPKHNSDSGHYVIMDNGVVETGEPFTDMSLFAAACKIFPNEIVLPDWSRDAGRTFRASRDGARKILSAYDDLEESRETPISRPKFMYVPHGETQEQWRDSVLRVLDADFAHCMGISRLLVPRLFKHRSEALNMVPELIDSKMQIHLLGCPSNPWEAYEIDQEFRHRIRGTDSGIAAIYTQAGLNMRNGQDKPQIELDFDGVLNRPLLAANITEWQDRVLGRRAKR